jgi:hypothetical protein
MTMWIALFLAGNALIFGGSVLINWVDNRRRR